MKIIYSLNKQENWTSDSTLKNNGSLEIQLGAPTQLEIEKTAKLIYL